VTGRRTLGGWGYGCSVDRFFLGAASPPATSIPDPRAWALAVGVANGIGAGGAAVSAVPWGPASRTSIHGPASRPADGRGRRRAGVTRKRERTGCRWRGAPGG
jgi:hypothetical protein